MSPQETLAHLAELGTPPDDGAAVMKLSVGLQETWDRIALETFPFVAAGGSELQFVVGAYGRGKTHFLRALSQWAREHGFVTAYVDCQDNQSPFRSLVETYRAIADRMAPPEEPQACRFFGVSGLARVIEAAFARQNRAGQRKLIERIRGDEALPPDFGNLVRAYWYERHGGGSDEKLGECLEALLSAFQIYRVTLGRLYREYPDLMAGFERRAVERRIDECAERHAGDLDPAPRKFVRETIECIEVTVSRSSRATTRARLV